MITKNCLPRGYRSITDILPDDSVHFSKGDLIGIMGTVLEVVDTEFVSVKFYDGTLCKYSYMLAEWYTLEFDGRKVQK